jgi:hypothetical protein
MRTETFHAVAAAQRSVQLLRWVTPLDLPAIRVRIRESLDRGDELAHQQWSYEVANIADATKAVASAIKLLAADDTDGLAGEFAEYFYLTGRGISILCDDSSQSYSQWSVDRFGSPTRHTIEVAEQLLRSAHAISYQEATIEASEMARAVRHALDAYDLVDWRIEVTSALAARMSVTPLKRLVRISSALAINAVDRDRLLLHEVGTHVLRSANARRQPYPAASLDLLGATSTEEGLAAWHEQAWNLDDPATTRRYAARVIAVETARKAGIMTVVRTLEPFVGRTEAIDIAIRVKRGLRYPDEPGGLTKDHAYLSGVTEIRAALRTDPPIYPSLMATKWPLRLLPVVTRMRREGKIIPAHHLLDPAKMGIQLS